jgi:hypothetical protein
MTTIRSVLHVLLTISIILVYGGGSVVAAEVEHSHDHAHLHENVENHHGDHDHGHHHEPVDSPAEDQGEQDGNEQDKPHSSSHSHIVSMEVSAFMIGNEPACPRFERLVSQFPIRLDEGCPDGPSFSLMKPPQ